MALIKKIPNKFSISAAKETTIIYKNSEQDKLFENIKFVLQTIIGLKNEEK